MKVGGADSEVLGLGGEGSGNGEGGVRAELEAGCGDSSLLGCVRKADRGRSLASGNRNSSGPARTYHAPTRRD